MLPQSRVGNGSSGRVPSSRNGGREGAVRVSARHQLLSDSWTADVENLERAIGRFKADSNVANNCEVVFFEIAGDGPPSLQRDSSARDEDRHWMGRTGPCARWLRS
jgi:hypothetical protein